MSVFQLVYVSRATKLMSAADLLSLLQEAQKHNQNADITGMLLYKDGSFIQVLEGNKDEVESLYQAIKKDRRHERVEQLVTKEVDERNFPMWSMGFSNLDEVDELPEGLALNEFLRSGSHETLVTSPDLTYKLLLYFKNRA